MLSWWFSTAIAMACHGERPTTTRMIHMMSARRIPPHHIKMQSTLPKTMKALVKTEDKEGFDFVDVPMPTPGANEVLVKVLAVAVCGSDLVLHKWTPTARLIAELPFTPGHELVGEVVQIGTPWPAGSEAVGDDGAVVVEDGEAGGALAVGDLVMAETHIACGVCAQCLGGQRGICAHMGLFGHGKGTQHGGCSEYTIVPRRIAFKIATPLPDHLPVHLLSLMEPLGVAHSAVEEAGVSAKSQDGGVLVTGAGPIGLMVMMCCKLQGASNVAVVDVSERRLQLARELGASATFKVAGDEVEVEVAGGKRKRERCSLEEAVLKHFGGGGCGTLVECSGAQSIVEQSFRLVRKGGSLCFVGLIKEPLVIQNPLPDFLFRCLRITSVHGRKIFHTHQACAELLLSGKLDLSPLVSHRLKMTDWDRAVALLGSGEAVKIILEW